MCLSRQALLGRSKLGPTKNCTLQAGFTVVVLFLRTLYLMPFRRSTGQYRRILEDDGIRVNTYCDKKFGEAWLKNWNSTARALCQPQSTSASSEMTFRSVLDFNIEQPKGH